ncbi:hypothetical protein ACH5RR_001038 [Cinchona calisaya]|uniref:Mediator complex subunit 15 KIX domain-containing protein n=1 Tax=Cinchona calisaya TaxID=153742 RepID=A0ABD3B3F9_9GENT
MDVGDWRTQLQADFRQRIINKIMETLKRRLLFSGQDGLLELKRISVKFEEKIYTAATSQSDYLRKISLKMLTMETKSQNLMANCLQVTAANTSKNPPDPAVGSLQSQIQNQSLPMPVVSGQSQPRQQLLPQKIQTDMTSSGLPNSAILTSTLPTAGNLVQASIQNVVSQKTNLHNRQSISGAAQNLVGMGQGMPSTVFTNSHRQMQGRQQQVIPQQLQPQPQQYLCQQQFIKRRLQQGGMTQSLMQAPTQQQQQNNLLQPTQIQTSQQAVMQPSVMQSTPLSSIQQNQQQQQQAFILHQQETSTAQQPLLPAPQQQLIGQQSNASNTDHNQLTSLQNMHLPQLAPQSIVSGLHQQSVLGTQSGNSGMSTSQHYVLMPEQSKVLVQQQMQQNVEALPPNQNQSLRPQPSQQQMVSQMQSQPGGLQQLQQQSNMLQRDMQQRLQTSGSLLQQQNVVEQQKQLFQSQRANPEASTTSVDSMAQTVNSSGGDWQEAAHHKITSMKDMYYLELNEMYVKITTKLQQHDSLPQQPRNEQLEKLKGFKLKLEGLLGFLRSTKNDVQITHKDELASIEKKIISILNSNGPRRPVSLQQGQLPQPQMPAMQHTQSQSQISQMQHQENEMTPQMQPMNVQGSITTMQPNSLTGLLHNSFSSDPPVSILQQNMSSPQTASTLDSGQSNALNPIQQIAISSLQQNPVGGPQIANMNSLSSQGSMNTLQSNLNNSVQSNSSMIPNHHPKQQEQKMLQTQLMKQQYHNHRQMQQKILQRQQLMQQHRQQQPQQRHQQTKQQHQPVQLPGHQMSPLHQMIDSSDLKVRQQMGDKSGVFQHHHSTGQCAAYNHQQLKSASPFPISSPQILQAASPQVPPHPSPQIDQQNMLVSIAKAGTPLQSANSPFVVPSPFTPLSRSPMPGESEKLHSTISSLSNASSIGHSQAISVSAAAQSLAIGTPGISASPLLAEFTSLDRAQVNVPTAMSWKSNVIDQPHERLIKAVKSISQKALITSVSDISSVASMFDGIGGSAPGNGSRAAVGEDLVAMTKGRLQARNFFTQDGPSGTKRMRRFTSAMPSDIVSSVGSVHDSARQLNGSDAFELESTATSTVKRPRVKVNHALVEEIHEINRWLIDTVVDTSDEDIDPTAVAAAGEGGEGTIVKCSFSAVALNPNLKSQYASAQMSPIQPLRLLVPINYPTSSPILLDKFPFEVSKEYEDLSMKAKSRFSISLRSLSQPMSLAEMAKTWDICARSVISEFAQQRGRGTFSSKYGTWENCLTAA